MAQSVLGKINYLTEKQYQNAKANGQINQDEIYMTPDDTKTQDVRLFYDANGHMSNIQLGVNKSQFEKLRIIYVSNGSDYRCAEIPTVSSQFRLYGIDNNGNGTAAWMKSTTYALTENAITIQNAFWKNINSNEYGTDNCIKILEVLGVSPADHIKSYQTTPDIYSTAETIIGEYLGRPLYRRVINFGALPNTGTRELKHNIPNLDYVVNLRGTATNGDTCIMLPRTHMSGNLSIVLEATKTNLLIADGYDFSAFYADIIIEYTKTTN